MAKEWYIVHTFSGHENKVKLALEKKFANLQNTDKENYGEKQFQVIIPTDEVAEIKNGKKRIKLRKLFPGYVLIGMELDDQIWKIIKDTRGVTSFVGTAGSKKPRPLTEEDVMDFLGHGSGQKTKEKAGPVFDFSVGEHIKVVDGPFNNFSGVIEEIFPEKGRLRVKVEIFGRGTPVELDFLQVGKI